MRAKTKKEVTKEFLESIYSIKEYWEKEPRATSLTDKMNGCVFSILAMLDGCNVNLPQMYISLQPHPSDKEFHKQNKENWFEENMVFNDDSSLHNEWQKLIAKRSNKD